MHDVYLAEGSINGERCTQFVESCLLPILNPFNGVNQHSVVIMDNTSIHHVDMVQDLLEGAGARLIFLPPYLPDLNPVEGVYDIKVSHFTTRYLYPRRPFPFRKA